MRLWAVGTALLLGVGCSAGEKLPTPPHDAATDTAVAYDAKPDSSWHDADGARDAAAADAGDAGNACPHVLGPADCPASNVECRPTWADVLAHPICPATGQALPSINWSREERFDCDGYHVSIIGHVDTSETYYYDATSGNLVAIYHSSLLKDACVAGPPAGIQLDCPATTPVRICEADGG
jgi:hypothetical protein